MKFLIRKIRDAKGMKQTELSKLCGLSTPYLSTLETGNVKKSPKIDALQAIASALEVRVGDLLEDRLFVPIIGEVQAGAKVELLGGRDFKMIECPAKAYKIGVSAVEIIGADMLPVYREGDVLLYNKISSDVPDDAYGRACICEDSAGSIWIRSIHPSWQGNDFNLVGLSITSQNMVGVSLKWAAPIILHWPKEFVELV